MENADGAAAAGGMAAAAGMDAVTFEALCAAVFRPDRSAEEAQEALREILGALQAEGLLVPQTEDFFKQLSDMAHSHSAFGMKLPLEAKGELEGLVTHMEHNTGFCLSPHGGHPVKALR
jgi:hypothetical protein